MFEVWQVAEKYIVDLQKMPRLLLTINKDTGSPEVNADEPVDLNDIIFGEQATENDDDCIDSNDNDDDDW